MSLNRIQTLCTGEDPELVLGHLYGLRAWRIGRSSQGFTLLGSFGRAWFPSSVYEAECTLTYRYATLADGYFSGYTQTADQLTSAALRKAKSLADQHGADYFRGAEVVLKSLRGNQGWVSDSLEWIADPYDGLSAVEEVATIKLRWPISEHPVTHPSCTCGIYAYTSQEAQSEWASATQDLVVGLVKASGLITQGPKGFRAQRASIVALAPMFSWRQPSTGITSRFLVQRWNFRTEYPKILAQWADHGTEAFPEPTALYEHAEPLLKESRL